MKRSTQDWFHYASDLFFCPRIFHHPGTGPESAEAFRAQSRIPRAPSSSGAAITATNTSNGVRNTATSDDHGFYTFPLLPVGR